MSKRWYKYIEILILIFRVLINSFLINFWCADLDFGLKNSLDTAKGQIVSEQISGVLKFSKKATKFCQDSCPSV